MFSKSKSAPGTPTASEGQSQVNSLTDTWMMTLTLLLLLLSLLVRQSDPGSLFLLLILF